MRAERDTMLVLVQNGAMAPLSWQEIEDVLAHCPDRIIPSRWHLKLKEVEKQGGGIQLVPKARWILQGHNDPDAGDLGDDAYCPTPSMTTINVALAAMASLNFEIHSGDLAQAVLQSRDTDRELYIRQPPQGDSVEGVEPGCLLRLVKEVYGTRRGPSDWRKTIVPEILKRGYEQVASDQCLFILRNPTSTSTTTSTSPAEIAEQGTDDLNLLPKFEQVQAESTEINRPVIGLVVLLIDDIIDGGLESHRQHMESYGLLAEALQVWKIQVDHADT
eukprot:2113144-Amphidinium_carterae.3